MNVGMICELLYIIFLGLSLNHTLTRIVYVQDGYVCVCGGGGGGL